MKPLLVLLLAMILVETAHSQDTTTWQGKAKYRFDIGKLVYHFSVDGSPQKTIVGKDTLYTTNPYGAAGVVMLLQFYHDYSRECWNDSMGYDIAYRSRMSPTFEGREDSNDVWFWSGFAPVRRVPRFVYIHREPTFDGFMKFCERQLKANKKPN